MPAFRPTATLTPAPSVATRVEFSYGASNRTACGGARLSCRGTGFAAAVSLFRWVSISGNCSLRCSRPPVPDAVYLVHPWTRTSSATVPDAALPPPSMESCIHAVVSMTAGSSMPARIFTAPPQWLRVSMSILVYSDQTVVAGLTPVGAVQATQWYGLRSLKKGTLRYSVRSTRAPPAGCPGRDP